MFNSVSMAGTGVVVTLIVTVLKLFGIEVGTEEATKAVEGFLSVVGLILLIVGQVRRKDLVGGLLRK